jgi:putative colanic acid biosynthesis acetyltransferase WcaF
MNDLIEKMWLKPSHSPFDKKTKIKLALWLLTQKTIFRLTPHKLSKLRVFLLRLFGAKIGNDCFIHPSATVYMPWNLEMGDRSAIDFEVMLYAMDKITIGDFVSISYKVNINTASHDYTDPYFSLTTKAVEIKSGAFVGTDSYVSPGVTIGLMTVIGARSTVTKDMPDNFVCFGHPCKPYKPREKKVDNSDE